MGMLGNFLETVLYGETKAKTTEREEEEFQAKVRWEEEKARIKAEQPDPLKAALAEILRQRGGITPERITQPTADLSFLDVPMEGMKLGEVLKGGLVEPRIDPLLTAGAKFKPLDLAIGKAQVGLAQREAEIPIKAEEKVATKIGEFRGGVAVEPFKAAFNMELVANAFNAASSEHADAFRQGGIGDMWKSIMSGLRLRMGGLQAEQLSAVMAVPGKYTEALLKMMPILTQQVGKEGTIRIIQGVFEKMGETIPTYEAIAMLDPHKAIPPVTARRMMANTLDSLFRFTRATQFLQAEIVLLERKQAGEAEETYQDRLDEFADRMARVTSRIELTPEEDRVRKDFIAQALKPLDDYIIERDKGLSKGKFRVIGEE